MEIASIQGCDRAPVNLADPAAALRLKSYVWAEITERLARIDEAVAARPGLHLTGAAYRGVGLAGCVAQAQALADAIARGSDG